MRASAAGRLSVAVALLLAAATARADERDPVAADAAMTRGVEYRRKGDDQRALEEFQRAYASSPSPHARAQIGLAQMALGHWADAYDSVQSALTAKDDAWIREKRPVLQSALVKLAQHLGDLEVLGEPTGAVVSLNGVGAGRLPLRQKVEAGEVVVSVEAPGRIPLMRKVTVEAGGTAREQFVLPPAPLAVASAAPTVSPAPQPVLVAAPGPEPAGAHDDAGQGEQPGVWRRWWFWTAAGALVAGGVVAALALGSRGSDCASGAVCSTLR